MSQAEIILQVLIPVATAYFKGWLLSSKSEDSNTLSSIYAGTGTKIDIKVRGDSNIIHVHIRDSTEEMDSG